jgi:hypothetical protein
MHAGSVSRPVVDWAKQNLAQPVHVRLRFGSKSRTLIIVLLLLIPALIVAAMVFLKLAGGSKVTWWGIFLFGFVLSIPAGVLVLLGARTREHFVQLLDAGGVNSSRGQRLLWENLQYVDHVSKITRAGGVTRKIEDNQLELVFSTGKAVIPPLIDGREGVWALINSIPAQVRDDGQVRAGTAGSGAAPAFDDIVKMMGEMKARHDSSKR